MAFECRVHHHLELAPACVDLLVGTVVRVWVPDLAALEAGAGRPGLCPDWVGALGVEWYATGRDVTRVANGESR